MKRKTSFTCKQRSLATRIHLLESISWLIITGTFIIESIDCVRFSVECEKRLVTNLSIHISVFVYNNVASTNAFFLSESTFLRKFSTKSLIVTLTVFNNKRFHLLSKKRNYLSHAIDHLRKGVQNSIRMLSCIIPLNKAGRTEKRSSINSWKKLVRMWYCFSSVWASYEFNVFDREMKNLNREYRTSSTNSDPSAVGIITIFAQQFRIIPVVGKFRSHNVEEEFNGNVTHSKEYDWFAWSYS